MDPIKSFFRTYALIAIVAILGNLAFWGALIWIGAKIVKAVWGTPEP